MDRHLNIPSCLFLLFVVLTTQIAVSQTEKYRFAHLAIDDGLSNNQVRSIMKDSRGFIWVGTLSGLNRFDGHNFKVYKREPYDTTSLVDNAIINVIEDGNGNLWIKTFNEYCMFDPVYERFERFPQIQILEKTFTFNEVSAIIADKTGNLFFLVKNEGIFYHNLKTGNWAQVKHSPVDSLSIAGSNVSDIVDDGAGNYWIVHYNGVFEKYDLNNHKVTLRKDLFGQMLDGQEFMFRIFLDSQNDVWVYTMETTMSLLWYMPDKDKHVLINKDNGNLQTNSNLITGIVDDHNGNIWIGTDHGGVNILNKGQMQVHYVLPDKNKEQSLSQQSITSLYRDSDGIIWIGTYKQGVNFYHEKMFLFNSYVNDISNPYSLTYNDVNCFCEDGDNNILIGTNGGGINYFNRQTNRFVSFINNEGHANSLSNNVVVSLLRDSHGVIWAGTYYGGLNRFDGKNFRRYLFNPENSRSLADNRVWDIFEDSKNNLWIGTLGGGLLLFDRRHDAFLTYSGNDSSSVRSMFIIAINEDTEGKLWLGTSTGVFVINWSTGIVKQYSHSESDKTSLSNDLIIDVLPDDDGRMWIATRDGLNLFNPVNESFIKFRTENGVPDNSILSLVKDEEGNLWFATSKGISRLKVELSGTGEINDFAIINYDKNNGIINQGLNERSAYRTSYGELVFGGTNGFYIFQPEDITKTDLKPLVYIVDFGIRGEPLSIGPLSDKAAILKKSLLFTDQIELNYSDNIFSIEFAALAFLHAERIKYRYMLEGFNNKWLNTDYSDRKVTFTNLDPGKYTFHVQAYFEGDHEAMSKTSFNLVINPPWWRSKAAFILYGVAIIGVLLVFRQVLLVQERLKFQNEQAKLETKRQQELNAIKTRFFTNISHEFRTPLTLVISPLERLQKKYRGKDFISELNIIHSNARRLLGLINQLLDFRKMEEQRLTISLDYGNIILFLHEVFKSFTDLAGSNGINYEFEPFTDKFFMRFDEDKLEKVMFNLLSNAFKFTHKGGSIKVEVKLIPVNQEDNPLSLGKDSLLIMVKDTGIGIPTENHQKIFERFFQNTQSAGVFNKGSGVGLSLTQEFVKLHNGSIQVESEVDKGSTFFVFLPVKQERIEEGYREKTNGPAINEEELIDDVAVDKGQVSRAQILLVEDNEDFRFYLRDNLRINYRIIEASDGEEALVKVHNFIPDLIVSDLMMPNIDGVELCKQIKNDEKTSHIPFILLTASLTKELEVEGFRAGTDAYITKPFSFEILESRVRNLLLHRETLKKSYQKTFKIEPGAIGITSLDEKLMSKALKFVEDNLMDSEMSVEKLSSELGFSRVHLYKKMLSITGRTPVEFIRLVRLKRAAQLLRESQLTVSEIAYQVGFTDPRYFSKIFKTEFKQLPSQYKAEHAKSSYIGDKIW